MFHCEECNECDMKFNTKLDLEWHVETAHEDTQGESNNCLACAFVAVSQEELGVHILTSHTFSCELCRKVFNNKTVLLQHKATDHIESQSNLLKETIKCEECDIESVSVKEFITHIIQVHKTRQTTYICSFCEYEAVEKNVLEEHIEKYHDMIGVLNGLARNQVYVSESFDSFKDEVLTAFKKINEDNNVIKQELFILRQSKQNTSKKNESNISDSTPASDPSSAASKPRTKPPAATKSKPPGSPSRASTTQPKPSSSKHASKPSEEKATKILVIGDSVSGNLHQKTIEIATKAEVKTVKAYSSIYENSDNPAKCAPRFPNKNFNDVIPKELNKFDADVLIVQSGSVDITNLKTNTNETEEFMEYFEQQAVVSANNLFKAVTNAVVNHQKLKKIIIMKQIPRFDQQSSNPPGLKPFLSKRYNETLDQLWTACTMKDKLSIGNHNLDCTDGVFLARYRNIKDNKCDGIHMYGPSGMKAYV